MKWTMILAAAVLLALSPAAASAQEADEPEDLLLRIGADVVIESGETVGTVVVIDGDLTIDGTVTDGVLVISGDATVNGSIDGDITVIRGDIRLESGSRVDNVNSVRGELFQAQGATVTGDIHERDNFNVAQGVVAAFSILFWLSMSVAVIVAGLVFAAVGGRQLTAAARRMTQDLAGTIVGAVFVWVALPAVAVLAIVTLLGLPLGLGILLILLPALWFLGYIVAGRWLGGLIVRTAGSEPGSHPYLATFVGLVLLQLLVLVPVLGAMAALLAGAWGAGALAISAYRAAGGRGLPEPAREQPGPA